MAVQLLQRQVSNESALDKILKGVQVAGTILQGAANVQSIRKSSQEIAAGDVAAKTIADINAMETNPNAPELAVLKPRAEAVGLTVPEGATLRGIKTTGFYDQLKNAEEQARKIAEAKATQGFKTAGEIEVEKVKGKNAIDKEKFVASVKVPKGFQKQIDPETGEETLVAIQAPGISVPGLAVIKGAAPTKADADVVKKAIGIRDTMSNSIDRLQELVKTYGTEILPTQAKSDMRKYVTDIQLQYKELANLGVLSGPDMELIRDIVSDPTSLASNINPVGASGEIHSQDTLKKMIDDKLETALSSRGYARVSAPDKKLKVGGIEEATAKQDKPPEIRIVQGQAYVLKNGKYVLQQEVKK